MPVLARAAVAAGVAGMFMETHPEPGEGAVRRPERVAARPHARRCCETLQELDAAVKRARLRRKRLVVATSVRIRMTRSAEHLRDTT